MSIGQKLQEMTSGCRLEIKTYSGNRKFTAAQQAKLCELFGADAGSVSAGRQVVGRSIPEVKATVRQMTMTELGTAMQESAPVNIAIINNGFLGMVRQWQEFFYEERYSATPMRSPDFVKLADAYGIPARRVEKREDVIPTVEWVNSITDGPALIDFRVETHDLVYPMVPAGADLHAMIRRPTPSQDAV